MKKRILSMLLAAIMLLSLMPMTASAAPSAPDGFVNITFLREDGSKIMIKSIAYGKAMMFFRIGTISFGSQQPKFFTEEPKKG